MRSARTSRRCACSRRMRPPAQLTSRNRSRCSPAISAGRPIALLEQALAIDASEPKAIALMGAAQYRLGNLQRARALPEDAAIDGRAGRLGRRRRRIGAGAGAHRGRNRAARARHPPRPGAARRPVTAHRHARPRRLPASARDGRSHRSGAVRASARRAGVVVDRRVAVVPRAGGRAPEPGAVSDFDRRRPGDGPVAAAFVGRHAGARGAAEPQRQRHARQPGDLYGQLRPGPRPGSAGRDDRHRSWSCL